MLELRPLFVCGIPGSSGNEPKHPPGPAMTLGNMRELAICAFAIIAFLSATMAARTETPDEWIALGTRVHGGFGSFIPVGIRIGLDALRRTQR